MGGQADRKHILTILLLYSIQQWSTHIPQPQSQTDYYYPSCRFIRVILTLTRFSLQSFSLIESPSKLSLLMWSTRGLPPALPLCGTSELRIVGTPLFAKITTEKLSPTVFLANKRRVKKGPKWIKRAAKVIYWPTIKKKLRTRDTPFPFADLIRKLVFDGLPYHWHEF